MLRLALFEGMCFLKKLECRFGGVFGVPFGCFPGALTMKSWVAWSKALFSQFQISIANATLLEDLLFLEIWCGQFAAAFGVHSGCLAGALREP